MSKELEEMARGSKMPVYSVSITMPNGDTIEHTRILSDGALRNEATWQFFEDDSAYGIRTALLAAGFLNESS